MKARILGSAAGGGVPQWNCRCRNCEAARRDAPEVRPRTQSSVAVSGGEERWVLLDASPDVRRQIEDTIELWPRERGARATPIAACVLTDAELDHTLGLLSLREGGDFPVLATAAVLRWIAADLTVAPVVTAFARRPFEELRLDAALELARLRIRAFELGRRAPGYARDSDREHEGATVGLMVEDARTSRRLVYAPSVEARTPALDAAVEDAEVVLLDGTFWSDGELDSVDPRRLHALRCSHWSVGGPGGSLEWLARLPARVRAYVHVNNTNPILHAGSPERREVERAGVRVSEDGDSFEI
jgi:pyrroloquinoline quinone biosynthesis protein B